MKKKDEEWAVFWCSLLKPAIFGEIEEKDLNRFLKNLSQEEIVHPNGVRKRPSLSTLRRKLNKYQKEGFDAFGRKVRSDRGKSRKVSKEVLDRAVELKRDLATRSSRTINDFLKAERNLTIPKSTLYRHLKEAGATRIKLDVTKKKVRKRWTRNHTHDLWVGDFEEGPYVAAEDNALPTHLSAFIDCHSRYIVAARYYFRQTLDILIDTLLRAWHIHGTSSDLYVDNAKVYNSNGLKSACFRLNIRLIHSTEGDAPPRGLIERFFGTVQDQFETEVRAEHILTLDKLNRAFTAWLEMSYHRSINSETGQAPEDRYKSGLRVIRRVDMEEAARSFMRRETRSVHKDFSDIRLDNKFYRVDRRLRGDKVDVRYDPYSSMDTVLIYSLRDEYLGKGEIHHREEGDTSPRSPQRKPQYSYLDLLVRQHEEELKRKTRGIDYRKITERITWSFPAFARTFARLLGRRAGLSAFPAGELEQLKKIYNRSTRITESILKKAFEMADEKTISSVAHKLFELLNRKED